MATHPLAEEEIVQTGRRYASYSEKVGFRFADRFRNISELLFSGFLEGQAFENLPDVRRFAVTDFPYYIIYRRRGDVFEIIAFAHTSRRPGYWKKRL